MMHPGKVSVCSACGALWEAGPCGWCGGCQSVLTWPSRARQIAKDHETLTAQARDAKPRDPETLRREIEELYP